MRSSETRRRTANTQAAPISLAAMCHQRPDHLLSSRNRRSRESHLRSARGKDDRTADSYPRLPRPAGRQQPRSSPRVSTHPPAPDLGLARGDNARFGARYQFHVLCEPIATSRNCDDVLVVLRSLTQGFAQQEDVPAEVGLFDEGVGPDHLQEVILGDNLLAVTDQYEKNLKGLWRQWDGSAPRSRSSFSGSTRKGPNSKSRFTLSVVVAIGNTLH